MGGGAIITIRRAVLSIICVFLIYFVCVDATIISLAVGEEVLVDEYMYLGSLFETGYIHSVQKTPVEDVYVVVDGKLWLWEERVVSHNAGLPSESPYRGYFLSDKEWMHFFGGRYSTKRYMLRVGDNVLGRNVCRFYGRSDWIDLFDIVPGKRCVVSVETKPFLTTLVGM